MDVCEEFVCSKLEFSFCIWDEKNKDIKSSIKRGQEFFQIDEHCRRTYPEHKDYINSKFMLIIFLPYTYEIHK